MRIVEAPPCFSRENEVPRKNSLLDVNEKVISFQCLHFGLGLSSYMLVRFCFYYSLQFYILGIFMFTVSVIGGVGENYFGWLSQNGHLWDVMLDTVLIQNILVLVPNLVGIHG